MKRGVTDPPRAGLAIEARLDLPDLQAIQALVERVEVPERVIPGLCRHALEAACMQSVRRRRLGRGDANASVEEALRGAGKLTTLAALALFDDPERAGEVMGKLNKQRSSYADTFRACNEGAHGAASVPSIDLVRDAENLARWLQSLPA